MKEFISCIACKHSFKADRREEYVTCPICNHKNYNGGFRQLHYGDIVRHFKGKEYIILNPSVICCTNNDENRVMVLYRERLCWGMYNCCNGMNIFVRDKSEFLSMVDFEKYPDVTQKYRFELIGSDLYDFD